jgi:hypothetical protein
MNMYVHATYNYVNACTCIYMYIHVHEFMNMYIHVCTMFRHLCTVLQYPVQGGRVPDDYRLGKFQVINCCSGLSAPLPASARLGAGAGLLGNSDVVLPS